MFQNREYLWTTPEYMKMVKNEMPIFQYSYFVDNQEVYYKQITILHLQFLPIIIFAILV